MAVSLLVRLILIVFIVSALVTCQGARGSNWVIQNLSYIYFLTQHRTDRTLHTQLTNSSVFEVSTSKN